ncbi:hypothetical protein Moror_17157 [Moniliophthora roreri MCA 2997]|uniref:Uncharacterized protein n=1 Tax=Moniliophthora roreri (strain MCA 2997) TaxID=1381753 RepID=V2WYE7_MONRO|nr:hypothetical protein Moror_17157 [Moniliophthora roreri MCA 2997]
MYDLKIPVSWPIAALGNDNHLDLNFKPEPENSKKRKITAAVLIPLLFIAAGILAYMKWQRKRTADKRKNFAQQVNKHMLTISVGWKSMSGRCSGGLMSSSSSFGAAVNQAGFGAGGGYTQPEMAQMQRTVGVGLIIFQAGSSVDLSLELE